MNESTLPLLWLLASEGLTAALTHEGVYVDGVCLGSVDEAVLFLAARREVEGSES